MSDPIMRSRQGDTVDAICHRYYGSTAGHVEAVLAANPGLAEKGLILPMNTEIRMPAARTTRAARTANLLNLWD